MLEEAMRYMTGLQQKADKPKQIGDRHLNLSEYTRVEPDWNAVDLSSLNSFADFVNHHGTEEMNPFVVIKSPSRVEFNVQIPSPGEFRLLTWSRCLLDISNHFKFGHWYSVAEFTIALRTKFQRLGEIEKLLEFTAKIASGATTDIVDNGVYQQVAMKQGVSLKVKDAVKPYWTLHAYSTFRELSQQPEREFLLRIRSAGSEDLPHLALFECDGDAWKIRALQEIHDFLTAKLAPIIVYY